MLIPLCLSNLLYSQVLFPTPQDNPRWIEEHADQYSCSYGTSCMGDWCTYNTNIYFKSDTLINNTEYNRLYSYQYCRGTINWPLDSCPSYFEYSIPETLFAIIRNDTIENKVYLRINNSDTLLYDFNLVPGQMYPSTFNNTSNSLIVVSQDTIDLNGSLRNRWGLGIQDQFWEIHDSNFVYIIEGIGSTNGLKANLYLPFENSDRLYCFYTEGQLLFTDDFSTCDTILYQEKVIKGNSLIVIPNPSSYNFTIEVPFSFISGKLELFSTGGQLLISKELKQRTNIGIENLKPGIYIAKCTIDGKVMHKKIIKE